MGTTYESRSSGKVSLGSTRPSCIPCPLGALKLSETPFPHPGGPDPSLSQLRTSGWEGDNRGALASAAGFPGGSEGRESTSSAGVLGSIPGSGRSPWRKEPTPLSWPGEFHRLHRPWVTESDMAERLACFTRRLISRSYLRRCDSGHLYICLRKATS